MSTLDFSAGRGMAELSDRAYRVVVQDGVRDLDALAEALGRDRDSAREVVDMLARVGLMLVNGEAFEPRPPRMPLQALADQYVRAAAAAREASEVLAEVWSRQMSTSDFLEVVTTTAQAMEVMARLHAEADNDVRALSIGPRGESPPQPSPQPGSHEAMRRGVSYRVVYGAQILHQRNVMAMIQDAVSLGQSARVFPDVPCNLHIADGKRAVLVAPMPGPERVHAAVFFEGGFLDSLIGVFETYWTLGVPITADPRDQGPSDDIRRLLSLLGAGLTDASIARELGVSERTVNRRIMALQDTLAARSRFQLGVQAARRGWL
ncbi:helix-turn-helix transcriptional regulator [Actinophytocola xinjiangensis]|nr:helix-turn-helix transcriptional regulator [Actinophytocola xinjiangensis]